MSSESLETEGLFDLGEALPEPLPPEPMGLLCAWLGEARDGRVQPNPDSMALATVEPDGGPSVRMVLAKQVRADPGYVVFYTNYRSRKGRALEANPEAAAVFHWDSLSRQARIRGPVVLSPAGESDAYFRTRPLISRLAAWASRQSEPLVSRAALMEQVGQVMERFGIGAKELLGEAEAEIPRPPFWGGYRLWARRVELWVGGSGRAHDRGVWTRSLEAGEAGAGEAGAFTPGAWSAQRLQP